MRMLVEMVRRKVVVASVARDASGARGVASGRGGKEGLRGYRWVKVAGDGAVGCCRSGAKRWSTMGIERGVETVAIALSADLTDAALRSRSTTSQQRSCVETRLP